MAIVFFRGNQLILIVTVGMIIGYLLSGLQGVAVGGFIGFVLAGILLRRWF